MMTQLSGIRWPDKSGTFDTGIKRRQIKGDRRPMGSITGSNDVPPFCPSATPGTSRLVEYFY